MQNLSVLEIYQHIILFCSFTSKNRETKSDSLAPLRFIITHELI
jgi:hypothetical protein